MLFDLHSLGLLGLYDAGESGNNELVKFLLFRSVFRVVFPLLILIVTHGYFRKLGNNGKLFP